MSPNSICIKMHLPTLSRSPNLKQHKLFGWPPIVYR
jgi:hypothetical protein